MPTRQFIKESSKTYYNRQLEFEKRAQGYKLRGTVAPMPHTISLAVNNTCFLRCAHCDVGSQKRSKNQKNFFYLRGTGDKKAIEEIPLDILCRLVDEVAPFKCIIRPTFLEPLLRKDLFTLGSYVKSKGLVFNLQTNGVLLSKYARQAVETGTDVLRVSLDGPPEIHDKIRGIPGTFNRVIEGLRKVIKIKRELCSDHPVLGISMAISGHNFNHILSFMEHMEQEGILPEIYVSFSFLRFITRREAEQMNALNFSLAPITESSLSDSAREAVDVGKLQEEISELKHRYPQDKFHYYFFPCELSGKELYQWFCTDDFMHPEITCYVPWSHCQVLFNGDVVFNGRCCSDSIGNIFEERFQDIWNGNRAQQFRQYILKHGNFPACNRCCRKF